ncbi:MAG: type II toxin-antitoxin system Phd/YefM family antitoxin [Bradymonadales bacterium]|nr:type II toxin-antitoxin system Phd/YefM family antitoxin [Bradymonadales bacterium]
MTEPLDTITISEFKATCLAVLRRVKLTGQPLLVTRRGEPMAIISPPYPAQDSSTWVGSLVGTGRIVGDIISPAGNQEDWEVLDT